jgi:DNA-binding MarR family transcriptional regulator
LIWRRYARRVVTTGAEAEIPIPALLRAARGAYAHAIRLRLAEVGCDDLPANGPFVIGGMANRGGSAADIIAGLRITKQAASQLVDILVLRGYLDRRPDPQDRRRSLLTITERGRLAAEAVRSGVEAVDAELARDLGPVGMAGLRTGLLALAEIRSRAEAPGGRGGHEPVAAPPAAPSP